MSLAKRDDKPIQIPGTEQTQGLLWKMHGNYKWAQTVFDVQIVIRYPIGTRGRDIDCKFTPSTFRFGLKGRKPIFDGETDFKIKPQESMWSIDPETGEVTINMEKAVRHENWKSVIKGEGVVDWATQEEMGKKMLLEKFTAENPGFDFSGAKFNGGLPPDPKNFCPGSREYK
eukprot:CAMPEP_0116997890 /NCGR_PEP_ID=MMETSP0472-20121206/1161_1 /TAXON_ID=693140 ORGANISM="Tiarina fusus, Strain LIS" /NCGR_SAMPLE_ID=MMETSP0472 /ASSEMBLY_ACC=CAM_ASM_000603 /LENGTH=171 /DNA_ID=CAMNT_0004696893 /DNA_START=41 /DNA_END=556 /DNA_ORIENTATION=+